MTDVAFGLYAVIGCIFAQAAFRSASEDIAEARARGEDKESWIDVIHILYTLFVALFWWVFAFIWLWIWFGRSKRA